MSQAFTIHLTEDAAILAVVSLNGGTPTLEAARKLDFESADLAAQARQLAAAIESIDGKKTAAIIVLSRDALQWQNYQLPPAPLEDLPDLVAMQSIRDHPLAGEEQGFDYLPMEGDEQHPHRVLGVGVSEDQLQRVQKICELAGVKIVHLVPRPVGWTGLVDDAAQKANVTAALETGVATIWATNESRVVRLRTTPLPEGTSPQIAARLLTGELRRTKLTLEDVAVDSAEPATVWADGSSTLFHSISDQLSEEVALHDYRELFDNSSDAVTAEEVAPLVGVAADALRGKTPLLDLVNPRRGVEKPSNSRTWSLAGVAAAALLGFVGWLGYENVNGPLRAAEEAKEQAALYEEQLEGLSEEQEQYGKVVEWQESTVNVLDELTALSEKIRPTSLTDEEFPKDQDVLTVELDLVGDEWTLTALAKSAAAAEPLETRLRNKGRRVTRQVLRKEEKAKEGYQFRLVEKLQPAEVSAEELP